METPVPIATLKALRRVLRASDLGGRRIAAATGLVPSQLLVLQEIARLGEATPTRIAQSLHFAQATVTNITDRLVAAGLVLRRRGEADRRTMLLTATPAGHAALEAAPDALQDRFLERFADLPSWEQAMILASLERLGEVLGEVDQHNDPVIQTGPIDPVDGSAAATD
ncbi:MarR family transcriptional regulator [Novosphingobium sp. ZN18A2]|uniref:MarR family winged helix-turn-helix transcriptional regulator n=1 Tax=Novosphingobium sp. ZN18A2 TaxID=3079861 RepID=UPI0030D3E64B